MISSKIKSLGLVLTTLAVSCFALAKPSLAAGADSAKQELIQQVGKYSSFVANFSQVAKSPKGAVIASSSGQLKALKPSYLLLHTQSPNELYLSIEGRKVQNYDPFVEQLTKSTLKDNQTIPFLYLLDTSPKQWEKVTVTKSNNCYTITESGNKKQYKKLGLCFQSGYLAKVTLYENNGNINTYSFSNFKATKLSASDFVIKYPENTLIQIQD